MQVVRTDVYKRQHKPFTIFMKLFIMSKIEIIDKSTGSYRLTNLNLLLLGWIYFRLEAL